VIKTRENKNRFVGIKLEPSLYEKFKEYCEAHDKRVSEAIREIIEVVVE
jgi:uncharacterized protein (DUF4415 family)